MIRIDLHNVQKDKINRLLNKFIFDKNVVKKIYKLASFLEDNGCKSTANLLKIKIDLDLFIVFGRKALNDCTIEFDKAIATDEHKTGIKAEDIKKIIRYGSKLDKIEGFSKFYNLFQGSDEAYDILEIIGANVCPYCNRQYTFTARKNEVRTRPQFDHFYPQALYPYLAISIYNLIPSCASCNLGKHDNLPKNILYPYEESFDMIDINFEADGVIPFWLGITPDVNVKLVSDCKNNAIINAYNKELKISVLYNGHSDYITELIYKKIIFNDDMLEDIYKSYPKIFNSPQHIEQLIFGKYDVNDSLDEPLSKLTRDILKQL